MTTLTIILLVYYIPIPFWSLRMVSRYFPFEPKKGVGLSFAWPILIILKIWYWIKPKKKPDPVKQKPEI